MELDQLKSVWHNYDVKVQKAINLNVRFLEMIEAQKVKSKLKPMFWGKAIETIMHAIVIALLLGFLAVNFADVRYFASGLVLLAFYAVAIGNSIRQVKIINRIDYSQDVVSIQKDLASLRTGNLNYARMTILCIPTFLAYPPVVSQAIKNLGLTYFSGFDIIAQSNGAWWQAQFVSSIVLVPLCLWVYSQLNHRNIDKPWVKNFITRSSGKRVSGALEFMNELDHLKKDAA